MPKLVDHLKVSWLIDNQFQVKLTQVTTTLTANRQPVETLEGLVGATNGAKRVAINGTWAIEPGGPEFDAATAIADGTYHEVQIPMGTKSIVGSGWFEEATLGGGINANTEFGAQFVGSFEIQ